MLLTAASTCKTKQKGSNRRGKKVRIEHLISKLSVMIRGANSAACPYLLPQVPSCWKR